MTTNAPGVPDSLWERLRADPVRAPEHIALAASALHAPAAAAWADEKRGRLAVAGHELARMAKRRHATMARFEGAATGVGGIFTAVPDIVLLAWIQSRLVFFIAAAYGFDPRDPMRPAELLVLRDIYPDPQTARQALDGIGKTVAEAYVGTKIERGREQAIMSRLLRFVGKRTANRAARRLIPGVAIAFNAIANERDTRALADKAIRFYGG
jgi:EcsC protein family